MGVAGVPSSDLGTKSIWDEGPSLHSPDVIERAAQTMDQFSYLIIFATGLIVGVALAWALTRRQVSSGESRELAYQSELNDALVTIRELQVTNAALNERIRHEEASFAEKKSILEQAKTELSDAFMATAAEALNANNNSFLSLAKTRLETEEIKAKHDLDDRRDEIARLVDPISNALSALNEKVGSLEEKRVDAYASLNKAVESMSGGQTDLREETKRLVQALRSPVTRGRWGEMQLRRALELAGMVPHSDFVEQQTLENDDGRLRPDVIVKLPTGRSVVVDSKVPLDSYLEATNASDESLRSQYLKQHARVVRDHIKALSGKAYWETASPSLEMVVLFLPGEMLYGAALEHDPSLIEFGAQHKVILATPTTLIALLRVIAYGWRQENLEENARNISAIGRELYDRLTLFATHLQKLGKSLNSTVKAYNKAIGSIEGRVLVSARRFKDMGVVTPDSAEIEILSDVTRDVRQLLAPEVPEEIEVGLSSEPHDYQVVDVNPGTHDETVSDD